MLRKLESYFDSLPRWQVYLYAMLMTGGIGILDYVTGTEISFSIFYLIPVALFTWHNDKAAGYFASVVSALTWFMVEYTSKDSYVQEWIIFWNAGVRLLFFLLATHLLLEIKMRHERENSLMRIDEVTGARNTLFFKEELRNVIKLAARHQHSTVLTRLNLNNFDALNNTLGQSEGNRILQTVVMALTLSVRSTDIVGRMSGNEYAVVLPLTDLAGAKKAFSMLQNKINNVFEDKGWPIQWSIGVAVFPDAPANYMDALRNAESVLKQAQQEDAGHVAYEVFHRNQTITEAITA
jgi:diguanylate cyclase (GGDEF)-like protein